MVTPRRVSFDGKQDQIMPSPVISKRKDSPYRSGRSPDWLEMKNPACEAVRRKAEEDWGR